MLNEQTRYALSIIVAIGGAAALTIYGLSTGGPTGVVLIGLSLGLLLYGGAALRASNKLTAVSFVGITVIGTGLCLYLFIVYETYIALILSLLIVYLITSWRGYQYYIIHKSKSDKV